MKGTALAPVWAVNAGRAAGGAAGRGDTESQVTGRRSRVSTLQVTVGCGIGQSASDERPATCDLPTCDPPYDAQRRRSTEQPAPAAATAASEETA